MAPIRGDYRLIDPRDCGSAGTHDTLFMPIADASEELTDLEMVRDTRTVVGILAGKWRVEILYLLATGTRRYSEVFYEVGEISKKTLTQTLRTLECHGLVARRVRPGAPPHVEYSLTPLGWSLTGPLMTMHEWAAEHLPDR